MSLYAIRDYELRNSEQTRMDEEGGYLKKNFENKNY